MDQSKVVAAAMCINPVLQEAVDEVMLIVERATSTPIPKSGLKDERTGKWRNVVEFVERHRSKMAWGAFTFSLLLGFMLLLKDFVPKQALLPMALFFGSLAEFFSISMLLSEVLVAIPILYQLKTTPFRFFFTQLRVTTSYDLQMVAELAHCDPAAVRYVTKHYQYHRTGLEKRGATLSGNIDKLGLFPALGAVVLLWSQLSTSPFGDWAVMLVPIILIFHILNLYSFGLQQRMDRVIAGLEFSVSSNKV